MNDQEFGTCDICGGEFPLARKYYYYDIKCDCCNYKESPHFEIVRYCSTCEPKPPLQVKVHIKPNDLPADYKEITGFNNPEELSAYEKGREDEHKVLTKFIKEWNGSKKANFAEILKAYNKKEKQ